MSPEIVATSTRVQLSITTSDRKKGQNATTYLHRQRLKCSVEELVMDGTRSNMTSLRHKPFSSRSFFIPLLFVVTTTWAEGPSGLAGSKRSLDLLAAQTASILGAAKNVLDRHHGCRKDGASSLAS